MHCKNLRISVLPLFQKIEAVEGVDFIILRESLLNSEMESDKLLEVLKHVSTLFIKSTH